MFLIPKLSQSKDKMDFISFTDISGLPAPLIVRCLWVWGKFSQKKSSPHSRISEKYQFLSSTFK